MSQIVTAILPLFGVVIGILLQSFIARKKFRSETALDARDTAYREYLEAVAKRDITALIISKTKITAIGSQELISLIARFQRTNEKLDNEKAISALLDVIQQMRRETLPGQAPADLDDIKAMLFKELYEE